jgi:hypothetical protein
MLQLDDLLSDPPLVHGDEGHESLLALREDTLRFLDDVLEPGTKSLETGAGISTILFALRSSEHTCITGSEPEVKRLRAYALRKGISLIHVNFIVSHSQHVLPALVREDLDIVLIDGGHGYPIPAIDWFYSAPMLRNGGLVIIDNVELWTVLELKKFLLNEEAWKLVKSFPGSAVFEKTGKGHAREWISQPYTVRKSHFPRMLLSMQNAFRMLLNGEFSNFVRAARRKFWGGV